MRVIFDGQECLEEYERVLSGAKKNIWVCMYMLRFDDCSKRLWRILRQKHAEGVQVTLYYDLFGSFRNVLRLAGTPFARAYVPKWFRLGTRNHAKVFIVDDKVAIVSGRNLTRRYFEDWVDASVVIEEPARVAEIRRFAERIERPGNDPGEPKGFLQVTDPLTHTRQVYNFVLEHIVKSRRQITIASPYFVIDDAIEGLLFAAMNRGVKVTVIVPSRPEHRMAVTFNRINFQRIHHKNLTVKRSAGMFHSKIMLFDDVALVGSANFDNRSFKYNVELSVVLEKGHLPALRKHLGEVADHSVHYHWIQRAYDRVLYHWTRHIMEFL